MRKKMRGNVAFLPLIILFTFVIFTFGYLSIYKSEAQELNSKNQKQKSLLELAQERDVEIKSNRENEAEYTLETLAKSEAIVQGRIINAETTVDTDSLYTTYTIEAGRIIKPFNSAAPLEAYQMLGKTPPEPIGGVFKITRPGGSLAINGHRISEKVPGQDELVQNKNYIFFLSWSGDYKTYVLAGGISGVVLVQDDLQVKPLATRDDIKKLNDNFFVKNKNFGDFLENLKKKVNKTKNSFLNTLEPVDSGENITAPEAICDTKASQSLAEQFLRPIDPTDPGDPGDPAPTPTPSACSTYNQCSSLQGTSAEAIRSPFTYSIDESSLALLPEAARQDFRNRFAAAAADWGQRAGVSITQATSGAGNVTVRISNTSSIHNDDGLVSHDPADSSRRIVTFSDEWDAWAAESKDRISSHEIGHLLGLKDLPPGGCPGVESIMRQTGSTTDGLTADLQLRNGYGCSQPNPSSALCQPQYKLPQPARPNDCDVQAVKNRNPSPTPTPTPAPTPVIVTGGGGMTYCEMYPSQCYGGGGPSAGGGGYACYDTYQDRTYQSCTTIDGSTECSTETRREYIGQTCYFY